MHVAWCAIHQKWVFKVIDVNGWLSPPCTVDTYEPIKKASLGGLFTQ